MTDVVNLCGLGTLVKKVIDNFYSSFFLYVEVQIEQIKMVQSFIGLAGLIFVINGKNWQFITVFSIKPHKDAIMLRIRCLCAMQALYFCNNACASLETQHVIWICVQVLTDWVYSSPHSALSFEVDDGNLLKGTLIWYVEIVMMMNSLFLHR